MIDRLLLGGAHPLGIRLRPAYTVGVTGYRHARWPSRLRARLVAAGVLVTASIVAPSAAAGAAVTSHAGLFAKLAAWPLAAKVGLATGVIALTALPAAWQVTHREALEEAPTLSARADQGPNHTRMQSERSNPARRSEAEPSSGDDGTRSSAKSRGFGSVVPAGILAASVRST